MINHSDIRMIRPMILERINDILRWKKVAHEDEVDRHEKLLHQWEELLARMDEMLHTPEREYISSAEDAHGRHVSDRVRTGAADPPGGVHSPT